MTGFDGVGNEQLMVERSSEGWGRQRRTVVRQEEEAHMEEIREGVVVKKEHLCKMKEEVEFGAGGSKKKDKIIAKEGGEQTLRQDSFEDNSTMQSKSKPEDSEKEGGVKSHQPLLLHRAPRYKFTILHCVAGSLHTAMLLRESNQFKPGNTVKQAGPLSTAEAIWYPRHHHHQGRVLQ